MASSRSEDVSVDFSAWLSAQGVSAEVARAMDSELGIRDHGVLRACVGDGRVRAELLAAARARLPFGFYAVLRQVVRSLHRAEARRPRADAAAAAPRGDPTPGGLLDVLVVLFGGISRELLRSARKLGEMEGGGAAPRAGGGGTGSGHVNGGEFGNFECATSAEGFETPDWTHAAAYDDDDDALTASVDSATASHLWTRIKLEQGDAVSSYESYRATGAEKPFACEECGKGFADLTSLKKHQMMHTGQWPHACHHCGKGFSKASHLTRHERTHTGERPYLCDVCGKGFSQVPNLKRHRGTHGGGGRPPASGDRGHDLSGGPRGDSRRRARRGKAAAAGGPARRDAGHRS